MVTILLSVSMWFLLGSDPIHFIKFSHVSVKCMVVDHCLLERNGVQGVSAVVKKFGHIQSAVCSLGDRGYIPLGREARGYVGTKISGVWTTNQ